MVPRLHLSSLTRISKMTPLEAGWASCSPWGASASWAPGEQTWLCSPCSTWPGSAPPSRPPGRCLTRSSCWSCSQTSPPGAGQGSCYHSLKLDNSYFFCSSPLTQRAHSIFTYLQGIHPVLESCPGRPYDHSCPASEVDIVLVFQSPTDHKSVVLIELRH